MHARTPLARTYLARESLPRAHDGLRARGGAAHREPQRGRRLAARRALLLRERVVRGEEVRVHAGHAHEDVCVALAQARPHRAAGERRKVDDRAVVVRAHERVDEAVDVVQRQRVQYRVGAAPAPRGAQRVHLRRQAPVATRAVSPPRVAWLTARRTAWMDGCEAVSTQEALRGPRRSGVLREQRAAEVLCSGGARLCVCKTPLGLPVVPLVYRMSDPESRLSSRSRATVEGSMGSGPCTSSVFRASSITCRGTLCLDATACARSRCFCSVRSCTRRRLCLCS